MNAFCEGMFFGALFLVIVQVCAGKIIRNGGGE